MGFTGKGRLSIRTFYVFKLFVIKLKHQVTCRRLFTHFLGYLVQICSVFLFFILSRFGGLILEFTFFLKWHGSQRVCQIWLQDFLSHQDKSLKHSISKKFKWMCTVCTKILWLKLYNFSLSFFSFNCLMKWIFALCKIYFTHSSGCLVQKCSVFWFFISSNFGGLFLNFTFFL